MNKRKQIKSLQSHRIQFRCKTSRLNQFRATILLVGLILCIVVVDLIARKRSVIPISDVEKSVPCYGSLEKIIAARSIDREIIVTVVNYAYIDLVVHWIYRLKRMNIHNFIVHVTDKLSAEYFQQHHLGKMCYFKSRTEADHQSSYALWGSPAFKIIGNTKLILVKQILELNCSVVTSEIDVVWFKDPRHELRALSQKYDVISQGIHWTSPNNRRNIGFFYLPCRPATLAIMTEVEKILTANSSLWDQGVYNDVVDRALEKKLVKDLILDFRNFTFEGFYLDPSVSLDGIFVAHLVGLDSAIDKIFVIKERAFTEDYLGYLSSSSRQYLTYQNPSVDANEQVSQLRKALYLANILNRTLVLPRFHCRHVNYWSSFYNMRLSENCTAERLVDIEHLQKYYSIRENSFLRNPRLPSSVTTSRASYNATCHVDQHRHEKAIILDVGVLSCLDVPSNNVSIRTCPPLKMYGTVLGYGPICK